MSDIKRDILVSISCITYNHVEYIENALEGFLMQETDFVFEILIHDDASTDGTVEVIKKYENLFPAIIKPIYEEENQWSKGLKGSAVFNIPRSKGKFVALCEGDDYWTDRKKLQKQIDFLNSNPEFGLVHTNGDIKIIETNQRKENVQKANITSVYSDQFLDLITWNYYTIITCSVLFKKDLYDKYVNVSELALFPMTDTPIFLEFAKNSKIGFINNSMVVHNILKESASKTADPVKRSKFGYLNNKMRLYYFEKYGCPEIISSQIRTSYYKSLLYYHFLICKQNNISKGAIDYLVSIKRPYKEIFRYKLYYFSLKCPSLCRVLSYLQQNKLRIISVLKELKFFNQSA